MGMTAETNVERLRKIKGNCKKLAEYEKDYGSDDVNITPIVKDMQWLIWRVERADSLENSLLTINQDWEQLYQENAELRLAIMTAYNSVGALPKASVKKHLFHVFKEFMNPEVVRKVEEREASK